MLAFISSSEFDERETHKEITVHVIIEDKVTEDTFKEWSSLVSAIFGYINESYAFQNCYELKNVSFPASVTSISVGAFVFLKYQQTMLIYCNLNDDGCIYDKHIQTIHNYPAAKEDKKFEITTSVTSIGEYTFHSSSKLEYIIICGNVESIDI